MHFNVCGRFRVCGIFIQVREDNLGIYIESKNIWVGDMGHVNIYLVVFRKINNKIYSFMKEITLSKSSVHAVGRLSIMSTNSWCV